MSNTLTSGSCDGSASSTNKNLNQFGALKFLSIANENYLTALNLIIETMLSTKSDGFSTI